LYEKNISDNLVLAGGCALNSSANGQILSGTPFKRLHVFSAPGDDGNAIGAALLAYLEDHPNYRPPQKHLMPYLGSSMSAETLENVKRFSRIPKLTDCKGTAPERAGEMLSQGKIIGWIQGRAEFGPRALGNRSILADPRSPNIKDAINSRVKFREEFRPFAPSILHEFGPTFFEQYQESPYMERTLKFKQEVMNLVPGVVHEDGTGRLQTVKREWNERYFRLIQHFWTLTNVPVVLNTSFNVMGKPISHSVEDVLAVFYTSGLDAVFVEDILIEK
jgi:carbamoyltransferase